MHLTRFTGLFILACLLLAGCAEQAADQAKAVVRVACAANARPAISEILALFSAQTGIETELVTGSSGKLTTQIQHGAPYDLFLSADMEYPEQLHREGLTEGAPVRYATGALLAWVSKPQADLRFPEAFLSKDVERIAIANPKVAPYGRASIQSLLQSRQFQQFNRKLVYGESIGQVNQYIQTGAVEAAITSNSFSREMPAGKYTLFEVPARMHPPLHQGAVLLHPAPSGPQAEARQLLEYLGSAAAKNILEKFGYAVE